ncbi:Telomere-associated protein [Dirofilaria immitis]
MAKSNKQNRDKLENKASIGDNRSNRNDKTDLFNQVSVSMLKSLKTWEELITSWIKIADNFCRLRETEIRSEVYLQLAEVILLAPVKVRIADEFSVRPRSMIRIFEAWENIYDTVIEACSQDSIRCCTFAVKLANQLSQMIACEKMDCRLLFVYSQIFRIQIEYFNYAVLNDVFVGDFDLSGKGNVLSNFCKLLIEIRKHSLETFRKHADKQTGIALELMSKSLLNILEAATSLVSLMTKPAHILFVVDALSEFMSDCLSLVAKKDCRIFCKNQTSVIALVKTALTTLKKHYSGPYDTPLLHQLEPIFINGLLLSRLRRYLIDFWQQTFGHSSHLDVSDKLSALEQAKCASINFASEQEAFSVLEDSKTSVSCDITLDFAMDASNSIVNKNRSPLKSTQPSISKNKMLKQDKRNDCIEEYVIIDVSHSKNKMRLTDHQKEKLMERSDSLLCFAEESQSIDLAARIPPGYTDSSSLDNSSTAKALKGSSLVKKCDSKHNCMVPSTSNVRFKSQKSLTGNTNKSDNHISDINGGNSYIGKTTAEDLVVPKDVQNTKAIKFNELSENNSFDLQNQTSIKEEDSGELTTILSDENMKDAQQKTLEKSTLSIRCKTPEIARSHLENISPKENVDEPMRTPNSILKKYGKSTTCPAIKFFSASAKKCKRVHFDASTLDDDDIYGPPRRKIFRRSRNLLFSGLALDNRSEPTSPSKRPILPTNKNPANAVFPALIESQELIPPQIYLKLAPTMSSLALRSLMKSRGVTTVGDLACMSEQDIETFPFRDPKLSRFLRALEDHFRMKNMVSKQDAIELEKIMKRSLNSPADYLKDDEVFQSIDKQKTLSSKIEQELRIAGVSEALDKTVSGIPENEVSKASTKHSYMNPFQKGSERFTPCSIKGETINLSLKEPDLKTNQIMSSFEIRQKIQEGPITMITCEKDDTENCVDPSSLSEHDSEKEIFAMRLPKKGNIENSELKSNGDNNMKGNINHDGGECELHDVDDSLRNAYRIFLEDSVVSAIAGVCPIRKFSSEQLLSFSQAVASFQTAVLSLSRRTNEG